MQWQFERFHMSDSNCWITVTWIWWCRTGSCVRRLRRNTLAVVFTIDRRVASWMLPSSTSSNCWSSTEGLDPSCFPDVLVVIIMVFYIKPCQKDEGHYENLTSNHNYQHSRCVSWFRLWSIQVLAVTLFDHFHEVQKSACSVLVTMAHRDPDVFGNKTGIFLKALVPGLNHSHSRVIHRLCVVLNAL